MNSFSQTANERALKTKVLISIASKCCRKSLQTIFFFAPCLPVITLILNMPCLYKTQMIEECM